MGCAFVAVGDKDAERGWWRVDAPVDGVISGAVDAGGGGGATRCGASCGAGQIGANTATRSNGISFGVPWQENQISRIKSGDLSFAVL